MFTSLCIGQTKLPRRAAGERELDPKDFTANIIWNQLVFRQFPAEELEKQRDADINVSGFLLLAYIEIIVEVRCPAEVQECAANVPYCQ